VKIYKGYSGIKLKNPVVTIGMFDGVHLGHQSLLKAVKEAAEKTNGEAVVLSFEPHPRIVLSMDSDSLKFLTSLDEKIALIEKAGIEHLFVLPFTRELSNLSACEFVEQVLLDRFNTRHLVVGFDHRFGRQGDAGGGTVSECAAKYGFSIERIGACIRDGISVSSTSIRNFIKEGDLQKANDLLGYDYFLKGTVIGGLRIGRSMGYPTANLDPDYSHKLIPCDGVYAGEVEYEGKLYKSMLYIGTRPTLEEGKGKRSIEANLFDFEGNMYGKKMTLYFRYRLRGDFKFKNKQLLREQLDKDKEDTLRLMSR
jgi:riboflavin kinase/FMN adenylyltransferase